MENSKINRVVETDPNLDDAEATLLRTLVTDATTKLMKELKQQLVALGKEEYEILFEIHLVRPVEPTTPKAREA